MKPKVYLETSLISYLAAWPSRDLVTAAQQQITHDWWRSQASNYDLFASEVHTSPTRRCVLMLRRFAATWDTTRRRFVRLKNFLEREIMWRDPIVEEVRAIRDQYAKQFDYDLRAIQRDLKARERARRQGHVRGP